MKPSRVFQRLVATVALLPLTLPGAGLSPARATTIEGPVHHHPAKTDQRSCATRNKATGTLRVSGGALPAALNPNDYWGVLNNLLFESLVLYNPKLRLVPRLLTRVPTLQNHDIRDSGKTTVLHLKHGLQWSNGMEITSADIRFGWLVYRAAGNCTGACAEIRSIETPDRYTAVWRLKAARPLVSCPCQQPPVWPHVWAGYWKDDAKLAAKHLYNDPSFTFLGPQYPTDGPYQVSGYVPHKKIVFRPMKYYHVMNCGARISKIVALGYSSPAAMLAAASAGKLDATWGWDNRYVSVLRRNASFSTRITPMNLVVYLWINEDTRYRGKLNPLANPTVRLALALTVDKTRLAMMGLGVDPTTGQHLVAHNIWINQPSYGVKERYADPSVTGQWDPIAGRFRSDTGSPGALADARQLLARTSWKHGFSLDLLEWSAGNCSLPAEICHEFGAVDSVAANWAKLGIHVRTQRADIDKVWGSWQQGGIAAHGDFQVLPDGLSSGDPYEWEPRLDMHAIDRDRKVHSGFLCCNMGGVRDPQLNQAFARVAAPASEQERRQTYFFIQRRVNQIAHIIPLYYDVWITTANHQGRAVTPGPNIDAPWQNGQLWNPFAWRAGNR